MDLLAAARAWVDTGTGLFLRARLGIRWLRGIGRPEPVLSRPCCLCGHVTWAARSSMTGVSSLAGHSSNTETVYYMGVASSEVSVL